MRKIYTALFMMIPAVFLSSCSVPEAADRPEKAAIEEGRALEPEGAEPTEEAIFTYYEGKNQIEAVEELYITLMGDPIQLSDKGYLRFKGAVMGERQIALVEISGKGKVLHVGDFVGDFLVQEISGDHVRLRKNTLNK